MAENKWGTDSGCQQASLLKVNRNSCPQLLWAGQQVWTFAIHSCLWQFRIWKEQFWCYKYCVVHLLDALEEVGWGNWMGRKTICDCSVVERSPSRGVGTSWLWWDQIHVPLSPGKVSPAVWIPRSYIRLSLMFCCGPVLNDLTKPYIIALLKHV